MSTNVSGNSEFLKEVSKAGVGVWKIIDDHMTALKIVNPKAYESVLSRIENLERA